MLAAETARKYGAIATFMAKPFADRTGSGAHMHYHLADAETGRNLFAAETDPRGLGSVADWRITSWAASWPTPAPCVPSPRRPSTATSGCRSDRD